MKKRKMNGMREVQIMRRNVLEQQTSQLEEDEL